MERASMERESTVLIKPHAFVADCYRSLESFPWPRNNSLPGGDYCDLHVNIDLHTIPGSQNGFNHSGKRGQVNWMHGVMGVANAQRSLNIIRSITEFIAQDQYKDIVPFFGVVNEAQTSKIGIDTITSFYIEMHDMMRNITGLGKGPFISVRGGFHPLERWVDFMPGSDRVALGKDSHPHFVFADCPIGYPPMLSMGCSLQQHHGHLWLRCCLYLNDASSGYRYDGILSPYKDPRIRSCEPWLDASNWDDATKENLKQFALAHMDAFQNYFWTWKIGTSLDTGKVNSPLWSYSHGLENGYMPTDPRMPKLQPSRRSAQAVANILRLPNHRPCRSLRASFPTREFR
ncbi:glycoside hydrolase family 5 protein [Rhizoctonia solani AG-1 IB]|uniref:glucan 1,3-beta-glucosidase n=1 Tax=Thanatephorus cucumeris (strain AG1-IB / isolate 7/3/14) TaxID=1108050 RepID=A0A0B7FI42_THACB|nr:glycoside hydrolase family 5 protein [Rhizoctonia solani AG-1 IB]